MGNKKLLTFNENYTIQNHISVLNTMCTSTTIVIASMHPKGDNFASINLLGIYSSYTDLCVSMVTVKSKPFTA